jgi:hypothetical protein
MRQADVARVSQLHAGLQAFSNDVTALPGIKDPAARECLVKQMIDSLHRIEFVRRLGLRPIDPRRIDPAEALFDPIQAAYLKRAAGELDEAVWLVFLATHFGHHRHWRWELTRRVYSGLGLVPTWTWARTSSRPQEFRQWFVDHAGQLAGVPFGNHRKYESVRPDTDNNLAQTVESYVAWIGPNRGFGLMVADAAAACGGDRKALFDYLYRSCPIIQFGRTAKFDLLTMLGKLSIVDIEPPYPYFSGASGPVFGAKLLLADDPRASIPVAQLTSTVVALGAALDVGMQVMEDSLCNWQKDQFKYVPFRG